MSLQEPTYYTLVALLDGPLHGYGIIRRCKHLSRGRVLLSAGTLYTALDRLLAASLVEVVRDEVVSGRARRVYSITSAGRSLVSAEGSRLAEAARLLTKRTRLRIVQGLA